MAGRKTVNIDVTCQYISFAELIQTVVRETLLMSDNSKQANTKGRKPVKRAYVTDTYDKVPQPKGKFRDLFLEMQERSASSKKHSAQNDNHPQ